MKQSTKNGWSYFFTGCEVIAEVIITALIFKALPISIVTVAVAMLILIYKIDGMKALGYVILVLKKEQQSILRHGELMSLLDKDPDMYGRKMKMKRVDELGEAEDALGKLLIRWAICIVPYAIIIVICVIQILKFVL